MCSWYSIMLTAILVDAFQVPNAQVKTLKHNQIGFFFGFQVIKPDGSFQFPSLADGGTGLPKLQSVIAEVKAAQDGLPVPDSLSQALHQNEANQYIFQHVFNAMAEDSKLDPLQISPNSTLKDTIRELFVKWRAAIDVVISNASKKTDDRTKVLRSSPVQSTVVE